MANMDYPGPCPSCNRGDQCFIADDGKDIRGNRSFWNYLSSDENKKNVDNVVK